jgi:gamma-glutamyl:cysteine ligase YbdK (ATP-grasp superfamily)
MRALGLFAAYGIEVEYMLVDGETLDVAPAADALLEAVSGEITDEWRNGEVAWNDELVLHVLELKCNGPRPSLVGLGEALTANVRHANDRLGRDGMRLMPSAMHPWMNPNDVALRPRGTREVYDTFDRIFSCKGHGWANIQSMQLNLPFAGDAEFARLHAAIRFLLPILPGLAASSPVVDGDSNGVLDNRLVAYRNHCALLPSVTGQVVPEPVGSIGEYHEQVLEPIYAELAPYDPDEVLRHEWVNARGAIARFDRSTIEIRVLDVQETPLMDVAYASLIVAVLKLLCDELWIDRAGMNGWSTEALATLLELSERRGEATDIHDRRLLASYGFRAGTTELGRLWSHLIDSATARGLLDVATERLLEHYLRHGTLATRIRKAVGPQPSRAILLRVYEALCESLASGTPFAPPPQRPLR